MILMKPLNLIARLIFVMKLFFIFNLLGCQTSPIKEFNKISLGNDKSDVIELIGGPSWYDRKEGTDRWTYILFQDGIRLEREIRFAEGVVAYIGEPQKPFISAEEKDLINAGKNLYYDKMDSINSSPINKDNVTKESEKSDLNVLK